MDEVEIDKLTTDQKHEDWLSMEKRRLVGWLDKISNAQGSNVEQIQAWARSALSGENPPGYDIGG